MTNDQQNQAAIRALVEARGQFSDTVAQAAERAGIKLEIFQEDNWRTKAYARTADGVVLATLVANYRRSFAELKDYRIKLERYGGNGRERRIGMRNVDLLADSLAAYLRFTEHDEQRREAAQAAEVAAKRALDAAEVPIMSYLYGGEVDDISAELHASGPDCIVKLFVLLRFTLDTNDGDVRRKEFGRSITKIKFRHDGTSYVKAQTFTLDVKDSDINEDSYIDLHEKTHLFVNRIRSTKGA